MFPILISALSFLLAQNAPAAFTAALQKIIKESRSRFIDTKGARIEMTPGPGLWFEALTFLPGAQYCQVDRGADSYRCEWTAASSRLPAKHGEIAGAAEKALGAGWQKHTRGTDVRFRSTSKADPEVTVEIRGGKVWLVVRILEP